MARGFRRELGLIAGWLLFPVVPVVLADLYHQTINLSFDSRRFGRDPFEWDWIHWLVMLGPLLGHGFLVGTTIDLPDELDPPLRGWRRLFGRRWTWVAIWPWAGFLFWAALILAWVWAAPAFDRLVPPERRPNPPAPAWWNDVSASPVVGWILGAALVVTLAYAWLWPAYWALRRAARAGRLRRAFYRGLVVALAFVGSLIGGFWAATAAWRRYFFDARVMPLIALGLGLAILSGCGGPVTYGEARRSELFHAMLVAWVLGLALMWRWWARRKKGGARGPGP